MTPLVLVLCVLAATAILLWLINSYLWVDAKTADVRRIFNAVVVVLVIIWIILIVTGLWHPPWIRINL
jgi:hypothetical protein